QFRLASAALLALGMSQVGPLPLARARWHYDLSHGTPQLRARAAENLVRSGARNLARTNLDRATLVARDLSSVSFRGATLREANLSRSFIRESDFESADLTDALVYGADLRLARLEQARGLHLLRCDEATLFPEGIACVDGWATRMGASPQD
ncbi:MAG TPA: pentapeptide repeat-containing protein, partial [Polyangiaceae bacterium]|nr:pentapeptide repeat-containing protein [Polyangiaceae bacterium]